MNLSNETETDSNTEYRLVVAKGEGTEGGKEWEAGGRLAGVSFHTQDG